MYEDSNTCHRFTTALFTFASDDEHEATMRAQLNRKLLEVALDLGYSVEIHDEAMIDTEVNV